jgi:hypothetical protein
VEQIANGANRWNEKIFARVRDIGKILFMVLGKNLRKWGNFAFRNMDYL